MARAPQGDRGAGFERQGRRPALAAVATFGEHSRTRRFPSRQSGVRFLIVDPERDVLERIRSHCDAGLRYYTWALQRMPAIPEQADEVKVVRNLAATLATVLAYAEGALDDREAMEARTEILARYATTIDEENWEPPFRRRTP